MTLVALIIMCLALLAACLRLNWQGKRYTELTIAYLELQRASDQMLAEWLELPKAPLRLEVLDLIHKAGLNPADYGYGGLDPRC